MSSANVGPPSRPGVANAIATTLTENELTGFSFDLNGSVRTTCGDGTGGTSVVDLATFTEGVSRLTPTGGAFNDSLAVVVSGETAEARITAYRAIHTNLRNASGSEVGTLSDAFRIDPTGTTPQPASQSGAWVLSAGSAVIGKVGIDQTTPGTTNKVSIGTDGVVAIVPATTGGWSAFSNTGLTNSVVSVKSSAAGAIGGWALHNPAAATTFLQFFNAATAGAVTLGTTIPAFVMALAAGASANVEFTVGIAFSAGIQVAATTTATGSTAPGTSLVVGIFYK